MHELQWDTKINNSLFEIWSNFCHQVNNAPILKIQRFVGKRKSKYELIAYVDAFQNIYGVAVYISELFSRKLSFLLSKNRIVTENLKGKSIVLLEFLAVEFGTIVLHNLRDELSGTRTCEPISVKKLRLYKDSSIALDWITSYAKLMLK